MSAPSITTPSITTPSFTTTPAGRPADGPAPVSGRPECTYTVVDSPLGPLLLVASGRGLVRVAFDSEDHGQVLAAMSTKLGQDPQPLSSELTEAAKRQLDEYFSGVRHTFSVPVDLALSSPFRRTVQRSLHLIEYGHTASYAQLARLVDNPKAVRAVGSSCATNPLPIVLPCHRVRRADGGLGGYLGGLEAKAALIALESPA